MEDLTGFIKNALLEHGAVLVGVGDLTELPEDVRCGMPIGISVAVRYSDEVIKGIAELPTPEYFRWYTSLNKKLDALVTFGAETLRAHGYAAIAQTRAQVGNGEEDLNTALPHKTVATRAGIGWIGKSALLVTEQYGSMIRLSTILTDAPLEPDTPINQSRCGDCMVCTDACPGKAISGKAWELGLYRDELFDPVKCRDAARERSQQGFGGGATVCGKCIEACPYTQRAWE